MRINIDLELLDDPRMKKLEGFIPNTLMPEAYAVGLYVEALKVAAEYWQEGEGLIPMEVFENSSKDFDLLLEVGLAKPVGSFVCVEGVEGSLNA